MEHKHLPRPAAMPAAVREQPSPFPKMPKVDRLIRQDGSVIRKSGFQRSLEGNEAVVKALQTCVDEMFKYKAATGSMTSARSCVTGGHSYPRKYMQAENKEGACEVLAAETNYGDIVVNQIWAVSATNAGTDWLLPKMGIDEDDLVREYQKKYTMVIETDEINMQVIEQEREYDTQLQSLLDNFVLHDGEKYSEAEHNVIRYVACRRKHMDNMTPIHMKYVNAYNRAKKLFGKHSTRGNFPRRWQYRGVLFNWTKAYLATSRVMMVQHYMKTHDAEDGTTLHLAFNKHLREFSQKEQRYTYKYLWDDRDDDDEEYMQYISN